MTRRWALLSGGGVVRLVLALGVSILVARSLGPPAFGMYAVLGGIAAVAGALADFGLSDTAVPRLVRAPSDQLRRLVDSFATARIGLAVVIAVVGSIAAIAFRESIDPALVGLALAGMVATAIGGCAGTLLQASGRFGSLSMLPVVNSALTLVLAVLLALNGWLTIATAIVGLGIVPALLAAVAGFVSLSAGWRPVRPVVNATALQGSGWIGLANSLALFGSSIDLFAIGALLGATSAGVFAIAVSVASKADLLSASLYTVLLPAAARNDRLRLRDHLRRIAPVGLVFIAGALVAGPAIELAYGQAYSAAGGLVAWLLAAVAVDLVVAPLQPSAIAAGRTRRVALAEIVRLVVLLALLPPLLLTFGPVGAAIARIVGRAGFAAVLVGQRATDRYSASNAVEVASSP